MSRRSERIGPAPPRPPRSALRRYSRWLIPMLVLGAAPVPVAVGLVVITAGAWGVLRAARAARARELAAGRPGMRSAPDATVRGRSLDARSVVQLGRDERGRAIVLDDRQLGAHGLILGASGSGKSTTVLGITAQQILQGRPMIAIDLKGSAEFADELRAAAVAAGRPFRVWSPDGDAHWNPLAHGNATELKDKLISTERFSEPHYQRAAERYVQLALQVDAELRPGQPASLSRTVALMDPPKLKAAARSLPAQRRAHVEDYLRSLSPDQLSAVRGLQSRLAIVSESHTGAFLEPTGDAIDLRHALDGPEVVLFSLNASSYGRLSAQLGALAVQDLVTAAGAREREAASPTPATVAIDEFSALGDDQVMALIARGRSAGVSVLLATQELADLDRVSRGFRQQVLGSTAVKIAHRQDTTESAHDIARLAGTERVWESSYSQEQSVFSARRSGRVNHRLVDRPLVDASTVQSLRTGEAVVITKLPSAEARLARIQPLRLGLDAPSGRGGRGDRRGRGGRGA